MTTQNKHNQNAVSILASNDSGVGETKTLSTQVQFDNNQFSYKDCSPVLLSEAILKALFIKNFNAEFKNAPNPQIVLDAYANDYLGTFHERAANKTTKKNPVGNPKKVLTALEYRINCIHAGLDTSNTSRIETLLDRVDSVDHKTTKAQLEALLNDFKAVFITEGQEKSYAIIYENEQKDLLKFKGLTDAGFTNIARSATFLAANIELSKASDGLSKLIELGFTLVSNNVDAQTMLMTVQFNEAEEGETQADL